MNLFLPEETIYDSVRALDDRRLIKQILECKTILDVALNETKKGYAKHPVVVYYKDNPRFAADYAFACLNEYYDRFHKEHTMLKPIWDMYIFIFDNQIYDIQRPTTKHFYCEGAKTDPNCIRTTENTIELFRNKLCKKWDNDKYPPKWTNRQPPEWYKSNRV